MFFHASFHKYTSADANTGNMYLSHVLLAKTTVIAVITCYYSNYFCMITITITDYTVFGKLITITIVITAKNVIDYDYNCNWPQPWQNLSQTVKG